MGCSTSSYGPRIPDSEAFFERYALGKKIGEGPRCGATDNLHDVPRCAKQYQVLSRAFGQVRLATNLSTKRVFAVKVADVRAHTTDPNTTPISTKRRNTIQREIEMWTLASAAEVPEITQLVEAWRNPDEHVRVLLFPPVGGSPHQECFYSSGFYYMVCEACSKNLMQHLLKVKTISEDELGEVTAQMLRGISHVHNIGLVHREAWWTGSVVKNRCGNQGYRSAIGGRSPTLKQPLPAKNLMLPCAEAFQHQNKMKPTNPNAYT
eukprot:Skav225448  [mRNA]  locus=scaffold3785:1759:3420:- [translate_table: standard]